MSAYFIQAANSTNFGSRTLGLAQVKSLSYVLDVKSFVMADAACCCLLFYCSVLAIIYAQMHRTTDFDIPWTEANKTAIDEEIARHERVRHKHITTSIWTFDLALFLVPPSLMIFLPDPLMTAVLLAYILMGLALLMRILFHRE